MYRHTQIGYVTLASTVAAALGAAALGARQHRPGLLGLAVLLAVLGWLFSSLTIQVGGGELRSHFGPGFWRQRVPLADVAGAELVPSQWWEGWGIRLTPRGMLYTGQRVGHRRRRDPAPVGGAVPPRHRRARGAAPCPPGRSRGAAGLTRRCRRRARVGVVGLSRRTAPPSGGIFAPGRSAPAAELER